MGERSVPGYRGGGILGCEFDGPDSGAGGDIKDVVDAGEVLDGGEVKAPVEGLGVRGSVGGLICLRTGDCCCISRRSRRIQFHQPRHLVTSISLP